MRPACVTIDLAAIRHNLGRLRALAPASRLVAVVKANAYGHGAGRILPALAGAEMLGVACIEEAVQLRSAGARQPILLMEGVFEAAELSECDRLGFELVVHELGQVRMLELFQPSRPLTVWLKLDSGMGRLGLRPTQAAEAHSRLHAASAVGGIRLMTHLASADIAGSPQTVRQEAVFAAIGLPGERSMANSAALLAHAGTHKEWVRPGLALYGASPFGGGCGADHGLRPAMHLTTRLIGVKDLRAGETVGYAATWTAPRDTRIGIAAVGYGDGYPRHAPSGTPVQVAGRRSRLIGRVSMDMLAVDLSELPTAHVGAAVTLWGPELPVEQIAEAANTIPWQLLCAVTGRPNVRVIDGARPSPD